MTFYQRTVARRSGHVRDGENINEAQQFFCSSAAGCLGFAACLATSLWAAAAHAAGCAVPAEEVTFANWAAAETATAKEVSAAIAAFEAANLWIYVRMIFIPSPTW